MSINWKRFVIVKLIYDRNRRRVGFPLTHKRGEAFKTIGNLVSRKQILLLQLYR